jgi:hypothetical protein
MFGKENGGWESENAAAYRPVCSICRRHVLIKDFPSGISASQQNIGHTTDGPMDNKVFET